MALETPPLRDRHAEAGAKFTEFGGWDMPVEFDGIRVEHEAVREHAGIFDVSHMSEIEVSGPDATRLMQRLTTNDVAALEAGDAQYATITDEAGDIIDDTVVYRLPERGDTADGVDEHADDADDGGASDSPSYLFVPNAGHADQMHERWTDYRDEFGLDATVRDATYDYGMFAVQGPDAVSHVTDAASESVADLSRFSATWMDVAGVECLVARTGYTGEDGVELVVPWADAETVWSAFAADRDVTRCGLGSRDTLRLEAGLLLSGQDFDHEENPRNPYEAGIGFTVKLDTEFVGRDALERAKEEGVDEKLVGFRLVERGVPRHGYDVTDTDDLVVGEVTSGTMSPTLGEPIGLAYVDTDYADPGTTLRVVVRGDSKRARVESLPFYER
ncbi:glycine cleavage system aminomethyltransferase GcvT [Halorubellus sp. JP-L1]|uniref:glycine cleavage system aminomethyltransferase GcvT n=1 Tax=Halorubellus sp. JP-L1 TaxID=2715753 RepID=UPI00140D4D2C|nr:glycine cleavage system aminomethyltransferase GcvT [Halorubellus sp. JP-L1]NHN41122.1 glycine cleavage system aminomethyltransferase GcvT [Halorubellus sp. JP-L1]